MLFSNISIQTFLKQQLLELQEEIEYENEKYLVNVNIDEYIQYLIEKYNIIPITLLKKQIFAKEWEEEVADSSDSKLNISFLLKEITVYFLGAWRRCLLIHNYPFSLKLSFLIYIKIINKDENKNLVFFL